MRNIRGTCSSVEMLKKYTVRERLGTPVLEGIVKTFVTSIISMGVGRIYPGERAIVFFFHGVFRMIFHEGQLW